MMTEEILKRLDLLAAKLQVTVEHLWGVLVQQAHLVAYIDGFWLILSVLIFVWGVKFIQQGLKLKNEWQDITGFGVFKCIIGFVVVIAAIIIFSSNSWEFTTAIFNPEYLALQGLGSIFK